MRNEKTPVAATQISDRAATIVLLENAETPQPTTLPQPRTKRIGPPRSAVVTLRTPGATLQLICERKADGSATTYTLLRDEQAKKNARGMTAKHTTFEAGLAHVATLAAEAEAKGWGRPAGRRGFTAKADSFSSLPAASGSRKGGAR
jgi:hypothetical protein